MSYRELDKISLGHLDASRADMCSQRQDTLGNGNSDQGASDGLINLDESSDEEEPKPELLVGMS